MQNFKKISIVFLIVFLYLISGPQLDNLYFHLREEHYFTQLAICSILYSYILIKIFHIINKLFPLKYLAYKNTYIIVLCIFVINLLLILSQSYDYFHSAHDVQGYLTDRPTVYYSTGIYYSNFLFILYILYSIKHYNKYYGTFLSYKTKYSFFLHIVFLFIYCIILSKLFFIMFIVYNFTIFMIIWM